MCLDVICMNFQKAFGKDPQNRVKLATVEASGMKDSRYVTDEEHGKLGDAIFQREPRFPILSGLCACVVILADSFLTFEGRIGARSAIQKDRRKRRKKTAMKTYMFLVIVFVFLRADANPFSPMTPAVNVSQTPTSQSPVRNSDDQTWCTKFMNWYSLSYVIESLLVIAALCIIVPTLRLRKWRRRASRSRTSTIYRVQSPIFGYHQSPQPLDV
ncbi:uncharacterized protein LOC119963282 [Scyliorhinus canicula]|uniref:uncharacterized protein LOC119963282 n=1 Tax=Scyliorhinus canicula TaxID=7830 RepID=UPI0018F610B2|nr:uncharacterized protein LOC119963282 [Scyliorhinus canicula]